MTKVQSWIATACCCALLVWLFYEALFVAEMAPVTIVVFWTFALANLCGSFAFSHFTDLNGYYSKTNWLPIFLLMFGMYFAASLLVTVIPGVSTWWLLAPFVLAVIAHVAIHARTGSPLGDTLMVMIGWAELLLGFLLGGLGLGIYYLVMHFIG